MNRYDRLIEVIDAFIGGFEGGMRTRGIKTALLIAQSSVDGKGISLTEIARRSRAPLETVRRHMAKHVTLGNIEYLPDPRDDRVKRVVSRRQGALPDMVIETEARLAKIDCFGAKLCSSADGRSYAERCDRLIAILNAYISQFGGAIRIRGIKTALLIQIATVTGCGISLSELARETEAPLENVRRHLANHASLERLKYVTDPEDERVIRVVFTRPDLFERMAQRVEDRLLKIANG